MGPPWAFWDFGVSGPLLRLQSLGRSVASPERGSRCGAVQTVLRFTLDCRNLNPRP